jgi:hypothetical protein
VSWCSACHAEIRFAKTSTGKSMPLDANPNPEGPIVLTGHPGVVTFLSEAEKNDGQLRYRFTSHFATCPKADQFRRKRHHAA